MGFSHLLHFGLSLIIPKRGANGSSCCSLAKRDFRRVPHQFLNPVRILCHKLRFYQPVEERCEYVIYFTLSLDRILTKLYYIHLCHNCRMQEPWYQGNPLDRQRSSSSQTISPRNNSELDLIKPRQPAFAFSKASKQPPEPATQTLSTSPIQLPMSGLHLIERTNPVKHFGTGPRSQTTVPASNTPTISIEAADRAFKVLLPTPTAHKFPGMVAAGRRMNH